MESTMWQAVAAQPYRGHDHFWQRAMSRRQFLGTSAGAAAAMATSPAWFPVLADASGRDPVHIPGGFVPDLYRAFLGPAVEPSTIFDLSPARDCADAARCSRGVVRHALDEQNFRFQSDAASTSHETFAELVNERNGSFFSSEEDD